MPATSSLHSYPGLLGILLLGSSLLLAQNTSDVKTPETKPQPCVQTQLSPWEAEYEHLLHNDWANLGRFRAANVSTPASVSGESRVVMMGDSITEGWRATIDPIGPEMGSYFAKKPYLNRGISGQTTPQMVVRFRQDVISLHPAVVVILAGTNDIAGNTGITTLEAIEDNFATMSELAHLNGIKVVLASVLPAADYPWKPGLQPAPKIAALNLWLRNYAAVNSYVYLDYYKAMATPTGGLRADLTGDGVHPNRAGYDVMAPLLQQSIDEALKSK